jgi:hypothetical protein
LQIASAFSSSVIVAKFAAPSEKVEAEESCNREPQPSVALSLSRNLLPHQRRLRLRRVETKNLSLASSHITPINRIPEHRKIFF